MKRHAVLTCAQKLTASIYRMEPKTKKWRKLNHIKREQKLNIGDSLASSVTNILERHVPRLCSTVSACSLCVCRGNSCALCHMITVVMQ